MKARPSSLPRGPRIDRERRTIGAMVAIYCRDLHGARPGLCADCAGLLDYAQRRLDNCPFEARKSACNDCKVHCYSARGREQVKTVMRYAGPRMLLRHPWLALMHLIDGRRPIPALTDAIGNEAASASLRSEDDKRAQSPARIGSGPKAPENR